MRSCCGGSPPFSGQNQGDAAAELEDDDERCGGGGARATGGLREEGDAEERRMRKGRDMPIYKGKGEQTGAKIEEEPNNGYLTRWTPRFSEGIKDEDPLGDDVIKVFCVFKR